MRPGLASAAPVNAPFSWPNSSDSKRFSTRVVAVYGDKGLVLEIRRVVDDARDEFLAGAGFALDQHRGLVFGKKADAP